MWRSNCTFIFKGVSLCCVSHLHVPHHSYSQSVHGNNYRWVFPFHYHFINVKTIMLKLYLFVIFWFRMWSQDILFKVLRIQMQLHWELCCMLTIWRLPLHLLYVIGLLLRWNFWRPPQDKKCFDDQAFWEVGHQLKTCKYLAEAKRCPSN